MRCQTLVISLVAGLAAAACTGAPPPQDARLPAEPWLGTRLYPAQPRTVSLTIEQAPQDWGPVTIVSGGGRLPVQLSEHGVSVEGVGSSSASGGN